MLTKEILQKGLLDIYDVYIYNIHTISAFLKKSCRFGKMSFHSIFAGFCSSACGRWSCSSVRPNETAPPTSLYLFIDRCKVPQSGSETDFHITVLVFYHIAIKCSIWFHLISFLWEALPLANFPCLVPVRKTWWRFSTVRCGWKVNGRRWEGSHGVVQWLDSWGLLIGQLVT